MYDGGGGGRSITSMPTYIVLSEEVDIFYETLTDASPPNLAQFIPFFKHIPHTKQGWTKRIKKIFKPSDVMSLGEGM